MGDYKTEIKRLLAANEFNRYFTKIARKIANKNENRNKDNLYERLPNINSNFPIVFIIKRVKDIVIISSRKRNVRQY